MTKKISFWAVYMNKLLVLTSYTKFELIHWEAMKLQRNYWLQIFLAVAKMQKSEMTSYLNNGYDVMNYFAKFENFYLIV